MRKEIETKSQKAQSSTYMQRILKDKVLARLEMIRRYYAGEKPQGFGSEFGMTPRNIYYIIEAFEKFGWRGLIDRRGGAWNLKVTEDVEKEIVHIFMANPDRTPKDIAAILGKQNITLSAKTIDRMLEKHFLKTKAKRKIIIN